MQFYEPQSGIHVCFRQKRLSLGNPSKQTGLVQSSSNCVVIASQASLSIVCVWVCVWVGVWVCVWVGVWVVGCVFLSALHNLTLLGEFAGISTPGKSLRHLP